MAAKPTVRQTADLVNRCQNQNEAGGVAMFIKAFEGMTEQFSRSTLAKFDAHISSLSPAAAGLLTASRLWAACGVDIRTSEMFLEHCGSWNTA